jgi:protein-L-isoaspartate(D-aspartate) O-methyltransferase
MQDEIERLQNHLIEQGIRDPRILRAMREVPRPRFCRQQDAAQAWEDAELPLPGRSALPSASLAKPSAIAAMLEALQLSAGDRVLELGTGSGYFTALLCELSGSVRSLEICPERFSGAQQRLGELGYSNAVLRLEDARRGSFDHAPWDAIVCHFALPYVPPPLLDQLAVGARLLAAVGGPAKQELILYSAHEHGVHQEGSLFHVRFSPASAAKSNFL